MPLRFWIKLIGTGLILLPLAVPAIRRIHQRQLWATALLRLLIGAAGVGLMMWLAFGIDQGRFAGQTHFERSAMVLGMMIVGFAGVIAMVSTLWLESADTPFPFKMIGWVSLAVLGIVLLVEGGYVMERRWGIYHDRIAVVAIALVVVVLTLARPWWFWEHAKARFLRDLIGDQPTIFLYLLIGLGMGWWGIGPRWGPEHAVRRKGGAFSGRLENCFHLRGPALTASALGDQIAYAPGFEIGFAIWMPHSEIGDTTRRTAYDGRWHRIAGDTTLIRIYQDASDLPATILIAPGAFPRSGRIELPAGPTWGNSTRAREIPIQVDSTPCFIEIRGARAN